MTETARCAAPSISELDGPNPFGIDPAAEFLSRPEHDVPLWSETMFFMVWSPEQEVGLWLHLGVVPSDKTMWWAQTFALLPDGVVLVDRSFGRTTDKAGPSAGNLHVRCVEPMKRWTLSYDGAGELSTSAALGAGPAGAGVAVPFSFEVELTGVVPVYDMHKAMGDEIDWGMGGIHHEQGMTATGQLTALGRTWQIDGAAVRDHSMGSRDFAQFGGHVWTYIVWPESGRALSLMEMWRPESNDVALTIAMLIEDDKVEITPDLLLTGMSEPGGHPREVALSFRRADGSRVDLTGEYVHNLTMTYVEPNHNLNGNWGAPEFGLNDPIVADETILRWTWADGSIGYGNLERGFRPSILPCTRVPQAPNSSLTEA